MNELVGSGIGINDIEGTGTLNANLPIDILDGVLNFQTAANGGGSWTWSSGGTLSITGCLSTDGLTCIAGETTSTLLVSDDFSSAGVQNGPGPQITFGQVSGTLDPVLAAYFGIATSFTQPSPPGYSLEGDVAGLPGTAGSYFPSGVTSTAPGGNLALGTTNAAPEDWNLASTLGLFGFGLVAFAVARHRGLIRSLAA